MSDEDYIDTVCRATRETSLAKLAVHGERWKHLNPEKNRVKQRKANARYYAKQKRGTK